ncbi:rhodanese-like domain-containing protein [uncultured Cohaesibacter sp.]|uniref:sulfurtransferase n=1 Tax=uncultured Cohaesibacter sp. TaxID=1002546 RepID=UPI0029C6F848|nr:rhodanese-like domain-containing protein [uncultured Cohaesibacter sp.]
MTFCISAFSGTASAVRFARPALLGLAILACFQSSETFAADPLVTPKWLQDHLFDDAVTVVDLQPAAGYARIHIAGSVNSDFNKWRQPKPVKGMSLPDERYLDELIGSLGISRDSHVVLAPVGVNAGEIAVATRIYWTFKVLGHENISILDGGLIAYSQLGDAKWSDQPTAITRQSYQASADQTMAPEASEVLKEWKDGVSFVDFRSEGEYYGKAGGDRPGTIPNAKNLPFELLVEPVKGGRFLSVEQIKTLFTTHQVPMEGQQIAFCNSGHRASLGWFVSHELLGNKDVRLYDGSMSEWTKLPDYPVAIPKVN